MKVLISAGGRTQTIIDRIESKLSSGGVDFVVVPFIEDIEDIYQRGEWFDRAIILEQSWSHDFTDTDVASMRMRVNQFANQSCDRGIDNITFVFLTQEESTASQIFEEILPIQTNSVVLMKKPKYKVSFMVELVTTELDRFPQDIVYRPSFEDEVQVESTPDTPKTEEQPKYNVIYGGTEDIDNAVYDGNGLPVLGSEPMQPDFSDGQDPFNWSEVPAGERPLQQSSGGVAGWAPTVTPDTPDMPYIDPNTVPAPGQTMPTQQIPQGDDFGGYTPSPGYAPESSYDGTESFEEPPVVQPSWDEPQISDSEFKPDPTANSGQNGINPYDTAMGAGLAAGQMQSRVEDEQASHRSQINFDKPEEHIEQAQQFQQSGEIPDYSYGEEQSIEYNPQSEEIPDYSQPSQDETYNPSGDIPDYSYPGEQSGYNPDGMYDQPEQEAGYNPEMDEVYGAGGYQQPSDMEMGYGGRDVSVPSSKRNIKLDINRAQMRSLLDAFANRGNSILVTGCGGCGVSTIALNLATIINNLGYTVLLVDLDTKNKAQSYISKGNFDSLEADSAGLLAAINSTSGINAHTAIVQTGFHLLTMGMNSEPFEINKLVQKDKIARFINLAKNSHNFVIYDAPFDVATGFGKDFTFMADNVVISIDCSNWGITKAMLSMCNIEDADMQETIFNRGQLLFNRYRAMHKVMGRKVKTAMDITRVMDYKVRELEGDDPGLYFQQMHICGLINEDPKFENGWYDNIQYADTPAGSKIFVEILKNIVLKA